MTTTTGWIVDGHPTGSALSPARTSASPSMAYEYRYDWTARTTQRAKSTATRSGRWRVTSRPPRKKLTSRNPVQICTTVLHPRDEASDQPGDLGRGPVQDDAEDGHTIQLIQRGLD